ncbi:unnamed protein product, partial [Urochloa humidicola]
ASPTPPPPTHPLPRCRRLPRATGGRPRPDHTRRPASPSLPSPPSASPPLHPGPGLGLHPCLFGAQPRLGLILGLADEKGEVVSAVKNADELRTCPSWISW